MKQNISFAEKAGKAKDDDATMNIINDGLTYYISFFVKACKSKPGLDVPLVLAALRIVADVIDANLSPVAQQLADVCYSYTVMELALEKQISGLHGMESRERMAKMLRWEEAEKDGRLVEQKAIPGNDVWIVERDVYGQAYDVSGFMFLAQVGDYVILSAFINDLDDLGSTMTFHAGETVDNYDTPLAVFPAADCYLTREEAEAALEGECP